jgi:ADP-ribose pyrophosphatase YjhB (NUDIX family)
LNAVGGSKPKYVQKSCAYVTRDTDELLVFEGPEHDGMQIPKGTIEPGETPREAVRREVAEESGLEDLRSVRKLAKDVWQRREARWYVRHFFQVDVRERRDRWTHKVTGEGDERGIEYEFRWVEVPPAHEFALALDEYVHRLQGASTHA